MGSVLLSATVIAAVISLLGTALTLLVTNVWSAKRERDWQAEQTGRQQAWEDAHAQTVSDIERTRKREEAEEALRPRLQSLRDRFTTLVEACANSERAVQRLAGIARGEFAPLTYEQPDFLQIVYLLHEPLARAIVLEERRDGNDDIFLAFPNFQRQIDIALHIEDIASIDRETSRRDPLLDYRAYDDGVKRVQRVADPARYAIQCYNPRKVVDDLIVSATSAGSQVRSLSALKSQLDQGRISRVVAPLKELLLAFDPARLPVLWRLLIVQLHVCRAIRMIAKGDPGGPDFSAAEQQAHYLTPNLGIADLSGHFAAAKSYVIERVLAAPTP